MALKPPSNVKNPVATLRGWEDAKGDFVAAQKHTQAECDEFNGVKPKKKAAPKAAPKVEATETETTEVKTETKKTSKKKKPTGIGSRIQKAVNNAKKAVKKKK